MFKWFKSILFKRKVKKKTLAYIKYIVGTDDVLYVDFKWDSDKDPAANQSFSELFFQINNGHLLESTMEFIKDQLVENGDEVEFARFITNILALQEESLKPLMDSLGLGLEETEDEVVVKPTDIGERVLGGNGS